MAFFSHFQFLYSRPKKKHLFDLEKYNEMSQQVLDEMGITLDDLNDETDEGYELLTQTSHTNKVC